MSGRNLQTRFRRMSSMWDGWKHRKLFGQVKAYCMFVGYPRSGHTLTGALLNAHPNVVMAHELDALAFLERGYGRDQIFSLLLERDKWFTENGSRWHEFCYAVPGQWQGRFTELKIVGDKKGGVSASRLMKDPALLGKLRRTMRMPLRIIHVIRNPFDNIATIARRESLDLPQAIEYYFKLADSNARVLEAAPRDEIFNMRHEDFVMKPEENLQRLLGFLGLSANEKFLADCKALVFASPSRSRMKVQWDEELIRSVSRRIEENGFLRGYSFAN